LGLDSLYFFPERRRFQMEQQSPSGERGVDPAGLCVFFGHPIEETTIKIKVPV
jgi:hypothetical protein